MKHPILKCIPIEQRKSIPKLPGVYIFINTSGVPIYIGTSKNLRQRVSQNNKRADARYVAYFVLDCNEDERLEFEKSFINHYKPCLNTTHKFIFLDEYTWV